jgi:hypothetical protein
MMESFVLTALKARSGQKLGKSVFIALRNATSANTIINALHAVLVINLLAN